MPRSPNGRVHREDGVVRVLVIEDEQRLAEMIAAGLRSDGFQVDVSHRGDDGLWRAQEHPYSAIVVDLLLPGKNGFEVCRELRASGAGTPILVLTAKSGEYDEAEALDIGADDFLSKPFSCVVLTARLRALVRRGERPLQSILQSGSLALDLRTRGCRRGDTHIALSAREYALLEALLRREGGVASKQELLDEVWGPDFPGDLNVVEVYIGYLRTKVDRPFGLHTIQTVRAVGYRLTDDD